MNLNDVQKKVDEQISQYGSYWDIASMTLRLIEEVGELAKAININYGAKKAKASDNKYNIYEEMADVLYTSVAIANSYKIKLDNAIALSNFEKRKTNDNKLLAMCELVKKQSFLYELVVENVTSNKEETDNKIKLAIVDIIEEAFCVANALEIDVVKALHIKVDADNDKIKATYRGNIENDKNNE